MSSRSAVISLFNSEGFKKYFQNTSWLMIERVIRMGVALLMAAYVARFLGPDRFGLLNYAMAVVAMLDTFLSLGIDRILVRELVKNPERKRKLLGTVFGLKFFGAGTIQILLGIWILAGGFDEYTAVMIMIIASGGFFRSFQVIDFFYQSQVKSKHVVKIQLIQVLGNALFKIILIQINAPLHWFAFSIALEGIIIGGGLVYVYIRRGHRIHKWKFSWKLAGRLLKESWPLILYNLAIQIQVRIDQYMLGNMLGPEEVGHYSVAFRMIEAATIIPMVLFSSFDPAITKGKMIGPEAYLQRRLNFYRLMFIAFLVTAIPLFFVAEFSIVLIFGEAYRTAGILLSLFSIRLLFMSMGTAKSSFIVNESLFRYSLITAIIGAVVNIFANYLLIPDFGAEGAIIATIISNTVNIFIIDFFYAPTRPNVLLLLKGMASFWKLDIKGIR